jgi:hypothetical protein
VPSFCRHGRIVENCPICKTTQTPPKPARSGPARRASSGGARPRTGAARSGRGGGDLRVRRMARAADDGYTNGLIPGVRATADARRLADEVTFATARLAALRTGPPGLYAEVAAGGDAEERIWLAFLIAYLGPLEGDDPFASVRAARVSWATGEAPALDGVEPGERTSYDPARAAATVSAYRAWAARAGSQRAALEGEPSWTPQRRFDRAFERLALPGFARAGRYDFLTVLGATGVVDMEASSLHVGQATDATVLAAKRVFGIGDAINLQRRAAELAQEGGVPIAALDLALVNWARPEGERITGGVPGAVPDAALRERLLAVLGAGDDVGSPA